MEISKERVKEFQELYKKEYGKDLSYDEAYDAATRLVGLADILFDMYVKDKKRKMRLKQEPKGFSLDGDGYTCGICGYSVSGSEMWYDKHGQKCIVCQKAIDKKIIPGSLCEDRDSFYKTWELKSDFNIHGATARKMVREGKLKARIIPNEDGSVREHIFIIKENIPALPPKRYKEMMMLLMSSGSYFTEKAEKLFKKPFKDFKIAYITTASKPAENKGYVKNRKKRMKELGWNFQEIDIERKNEDKLRELLQDKQIIFIEGGNTFYLLKHIRKSGFEKVVKDLMTSRGVLYAGSSAGAYVACPTIEMATWLDRHNWDRCGLTDLTAMGLVPFLIKAHYTSDDEKLLKDKIKSAKYETKILTDEQAIFISNGDVHFLDSKS